MMRPVPVALLLALLLSLASGCLDDGDDGNGRPGPGRDEDGGGWDEDDAFPSPWDYDIEELEGRTAQTLGQRDVGTPGPASSFPFKVVVPPGGAVAVEWRLELTGVNVDAYVEGPHCPRDGMQVGGLGAGTSTLSGTCGDLPEGSHGFSVVHTAGAVEMHAEVRGLVLAR